MKIGIIGGSGLDDPNIFEVEDEQVIHTQFGKPSSPIKEGKIRYSISFKVLTLSPIHNMVVVTSPIGDQAPPALAAMMIKPANQILSLLFGIIFLSIVIRTIVAVKLSIIAERMKANMEMIHNRVDFLLVLIYHNVLYGIVLRNKTFPAALRAPE